MSSLGNKQIMSKNIQYYMQQKGKTRNDVCSDLQIKYTTFADWINAVTYPRIDKIEIMANYFEISKADLVEAFIRGGDVDIVEPGVDELREEIKALRYSLGKLGLVKVRDYMRDLMHNPENRPD